MITKTNAQEDQADKAFAAKPKAICALCRHPYERIVGLDSKGNYAPFCSRGCAARDQLNWLNGHYVIKDDGQLGHADEHDLGDEKD